MPRPGPLASLALALGLAVSLVGCGTGADRTALAVTDHRWVGTDRLAVHTECADDVRAEVGEDLDGSGLTQITVWGTPRWGRCAPEVVVSLPTGTPQVVDGTTGTVIDLVPSTP